MAKLAKQDLDVLEQEPGWLALLEQLRGLKQNLILKNAFDLHEEIVDRAVNVGQMKMIDEILRWTELQRRTIK